MSVLLDRAKQYFVWESKIEVEGRSYPFWVVQDGFWPGLSYFAVIVSGILMVSQSVPLEFREYVLEHEIRCHARRERPGYRQDLTFEEIHRIRRKFVRASQEYVNFRFDFFDELVKFWESQKDKPPDLEELRNLRAWLRKLAWGE